MAVYFDHKIQAPSVGVQTDIAWHSNYPLLAVASKNDPGVGGAVNFYLDEGELVEDSSIQRSSDVTAFAWHPSRKILAVGWESGDVLIWNEHDHELHEAPSVHSSPVRIIEWNSNGGRLVTGDENGDVVVWKADQRGRLNQTPVFQHNVQSAIKTCVFKASGSEAANDEPSWRKSKLAALSQASIDSSFFVGTVNGTVHYMDDKGRCVESFTTDGPVKTLLYTEGKGVLVAVTDGLMLSQHTVAKDGSTTEIMKVKLSGQAAKSQMIWAGKQILATASGESLVRMWDLDQDDNFVLSLDGGAFESGECINKISYNKSKGILAGCTNKGKVAMWRYMPSKSKTDVQSRWELQPASVLEGEGELTQIQFAGSKNLLAVNCVATVIILNEQVMNAHYNLQVAAVQVSPSQLTVENFVSLFNQDLKTDIHIKGVFVTKSHTTIWNGKRIVVYEVSPDKAMVRAEGSFNSDSPVVVLHEQSVYTVEPGKIQVRTFQGTVKQVLPFSETEGDPILLDLCGNYLVAGTSLGYVKVWDLSRREAKQHCTPKSLSESIPDVGKLKCVKCNCNGTKVSILVEKPSNTPDSKIYIWDIDTDTIHAFDFATGQEVGGDLDDGPDLVGRAQQAADIAGRIPTAQFWDATDPKLIVCETINSSNTITSGKERITKKLFSITPKEKKEQEQQKDVMIVSLFSIPENGTLLQDYFSIDSTQSKLMGVQVPFMFLMRKGSNDTRTSSEGIPPKSPPAYHKRMVIKHTMKDFIGLENANEEAKKAMMDFSYLSAIGNMDEAFKAIKLIKSESVWENMARMCVKTKRLDVATVCLGNMGNARAAKSLRESLQEPELDARVAMLALQLGMLEEAEKLYINCQRFDLLNKMYQASNQWTKDLPIEEWTAATVDQILVEGDRLYLDALESRSIPDAETLSLNYLPDTAVEVAELQDRIHLRSTYYNYAKHLEAMGNVSGAIHNYEKSETQRFEVPRMLLDEPQQLEAYILKTKDKELRKWWAQYMESTSEMETALQFYEAARDNLSLVRVYCYCGNLEKAAEICNETGDRAACYHLARQFENQDNIKDAIHFYTRAHCYSNAIRLAKDHGLDNELMNLALLSAPKDMIEVARYYESQPNMQDKAVVLYHKGGNITRALDLCFRTQQFAALQVVAEDLDENTDPAMIDKCAEFFMEHGQYDKAVDLYIIGKKYSEALDLCLAHNVTITEELAEKMTLPKGEANRGAMLEQIAECAMQQGSYHLATKKFTQAGNKMKAMKALLKSGDTEKIVFFAGVSRQREIYVMAANYLQSLDWRKDPEIMKNIIGFYNKGRALDLLAGFYDACAQVEIDEYQNYDKALGAMTEAYKCMAKAKMKNVMEQEEKVAFLKQRIGLIKKFVQARRAYEENPEEAIKSCQLLLEEPDLETAVRIGDVYGLIIEHFAREQNYSKAYSSMEDMRQRVPTVNMAYYVNIKTIEAVHKSLGIPLGRGMGAERDIKGGMDEEEGEEVEEEVEEEIFNGHDDY